MAVAFSHPFYGNPCQISGGRRFLFSLALTFALFSIPRAQAACIDKTGFAYGDCVQGELRAVLGEPLKSMSLEELTGGVFEKLPESRLALNNRGIYRVKVDGKPYLIKTGGENQRGFKDDEAFRANVYGYLLASELGGPKVIRAGRLLDPKWPNSNYYYIEMEELFAGVSQVKTYKGKRFVPTIAQMKKLSKLFRAIIERRIRMEDLDFMFLDDDIRFIDVQGWSVDSFEGQSPFDFLWAPAGMFHNLHMLSSQSVAERFVRLFLKELESSEILSSDEKKLLRDQLRNNQMIQMWEKDSVERAFGKEITWSACAALLQSTILKIKNMGRPPFKD